MMLFFIIAAAAFFIVIILNTLTAGRFDRNVHYRPEKASDEAVDRLIKAVRIPTVSHYDLSRNDTEQFRKFQSFLVEAFPVFNNTAERTLLNDYSIIYKWKGRHDEKSSELPPVLLTAHYDVVPAYDDKWTHPPFEGVIDSGFIWGRGTLDTKNTLMAALEAAEWLCSSGFIPNRTIFFAFGGDEETTGRMGACKSVEWFNQNGIKFDWLWDEGAITADGLMPGMIKKLSLIGTAEKGQVNILLKTVSSGGAHAAMPPKISSVGRISRAIARLEAKPFPLRWLKTTRTFFRKMAGAGIPFYRIALSNLWLTGGLIKLIMGLKPSSAALLRTTAAPTMIAGSAKENVLSDEASAVLNVRILPGDSLESVIARIKKVINDGNITVSVMNEDDAAEPSPESSINSEGYLLLEQMLNEVIEDSVVLPYLATTASDARNYISCCKNAFRYAPMILNQEELDRIHGVDERISFENYGLGIRCYKNLIKRL